VLQIVQEPLHIINNFLKMDILSGKDSLILKTFNKTGGSLLPYPKAGEGRVREGGEDVCGEVSPDGGTVDGRKGGGSMEGV
jgi:hypothetical protein